MADDKEKMSLFEFIKQLKENVDVPPDMSDKDIIKAVLKAKPELRSKFNSYEVSRLTGEARSADEIFKPENAISPDPGKMPEGNAVTRYFKGLFDQLSPDKLAAMGMASSPFTDPDRQGKTLMEQNTGIKPEDAIAHPSDSAQKFANVPGMTKSFQQGDIAGGLGKGTFSATMIRGMAGGEGGAAEETPGAALARFKKMTESVAAPLKATLDSQYTAIDGAMANQYINAQRLSAGIAHAKNVIAKISKSPGVKTGDLSAAQDVVARLGNKVKANKNMPWTDARQALVDLNQAKMKVQAGAVKKGLNEITDALEPELTDSAKQAGQGGQWEKLQKDYAEFSNLKREYEKILKEATDTQKQTKITAKSSPSLRVAGSTPIRLGRSQRGKIVKTNTDMIKAAHDAFKDLHEQIKTPPKPQPPTPNPNNPPPVSGGSQGAGGEKGTWSADPRGAEAILQANKDMQKPPAGQGGGAPAPEPQWPANYLQSPQSLGKGVGGGANYSADQLAEFKNKHGIE